jgi:dipeptidase E
MQSQVKIALDGGGNSDDSRLLNELFVKWMGPRGRLLYWPVALRGMRPFQSCQEWITEALAPMQVSDISMWTDLTAHQAAELDEYDAVYIGGGNTYALLAELQQSGFENHLKAFIQRGMPVCGGSAGAIVLGFDILTAQHFDRNNSTLAGTRGLDLAAGHAIWPHYRPRHDDWINACISQYHYPILAIPERSGIVIENSEMRTVGFEPSYRFDVHGRSEV